MRPLRSVLLAAVAASAMATALRAQHAARRAAKLVAVAQSTGATSPSLTLYGGLATGDGVFDPGPALGASFNWRLATLPFNLRLDPYFAYHSTDVGGDGAIWFLGASGNAEVAFRIAASNTQLYLLGGLGLYFRSLSFEDTAGEVDDRGFDAGFGLGGGVRIGGFTLEAKMYNIAEFTTVALLAGFRLGG